MSLHKITELGYRTDHIEALKDAPWIMKDHADRKKIQLAGLGDVGSNLLIGLRLLAGDFFESIGIYDLDHSRCLRWEMELNQIREACTEKRMAPVNIVEEENLFDCDIFVFCIARNVPAVGNEKKDVRLVQLEANGKIVASYARLAASRNYKGLFVVVSDPVDLLCNVAYHAAKQGDYPLHPYQFQGCGLGVMNARASYFAQKEERFCQYLKEGRAFGPHGDKLVIANSIDTKKYDSALSEELTKKTVTANLAMREIGYKPYVAPSLSSGALTIMRIVRGLWNYSAQYLNGVYFGAKNRSTEEGVHWEDVEIPDALWGRLQNAYDWLYEMGKKNESVDGH